MANGQELSSSFSCVLTMPLRVPVFCFVFPPFILLFIVYTPNCQIQFGQFAYAHTLSYFTLTWFSIFARKKNGNNNNKKKTAREKKAAKRSSSPHLNLYGFSDSCLCILKIQNKPTQQDSQTRNKSILKRAVQLKRRQSTEKKSTHIIYYYCCLLPLYPCIQTRTDRLNVCSFISFRCVMRAHISRFSISFRSLRNFFFPFCLSTLNWCQHLSAVFFFLLSCSYTYIEPIASDECVREWDRLSKYWIETIRYEWPKSWSETARHSMVVTNTSIDIKNGRSAYKLTKWNWVIHARLPHAHTLNRNDINIHTHTHTIQTLTLSVSQRLIESISHRKWFAYVCLFPTFVHFEYRLSSMLFFHMDALFAIRSHYIYSKKNRFLFSFKWKLKKNSYWMNLRISIDYRI